MFQKISNLLGSNFHKRELHKLAAISDAVNELETEYEKLSQDALRAKTDEFKARLNDGESLDDIKVEAFAAVREATKRTLGQRQYDVQVIGGAALHHGQIIEMRTGEGKTLVATMPVYLNALLGKGVHLVTVNDYLARRDARWMAPIYNLLGLSVGVLQMASRTENGRKAFLVNLEKTSSQEDQHQLQLVDRQMAYSADVTYGTNSEFGFDYLRDNLTMRLDDRVQRPHYYCIIDEVDNILIDEARTPLIISGPASENSESYIKMAQIVRQLNPEDYEISERDKTVTLTEVGEARVEEILGEPLRDPERPEDITPEQARNLGFLEQALRAQFLYRRNKEYLVQGGKVLIIDEFTGRLMPGRRWSEGLHQAVEAKEGVKVEPENITYATITIQNYFRMYKKLAGMTGTALTEAEEFSKIYKLEVFSLPTNLEYTAERGSSNIIAVNDKDEAGYRYTYYTTKDSPDKKPLYWKRKDYPDVVFLTMEAKLRAIVQEILYFHVLGRPQLVGTTSVENSELLSNRLSTESIRRLAQVLLLRNTWMTQHNKEIIERAYPELKPLNVPLQDLAIPELRRMARSLNISLNPEDPENLTLLLSILKLTPESAPRLVAALEGGIPHQVLNARKHDEESQIIARAGAFAAVTIATNMAGRGVDIKLGGELPEELIADVVRVLSKSGFEDPYDMSNQQKRQALQAIPVENYGIYEESVQAFLKAMEDSDKVRALGGLHVIGSERHEARRIDNQLRGRSARQGDPGSSRFFLSLEDDLMRIFGGQQAENMFKRLSIDENMPIEHNILGKLVEQSQERVEGSNFDVRKHLLEYDDVLNSQRERIYGQRNLVFEKEDLDEDIQDMLRIELRERIPQALKDKEGPWKLLAYLDESQPTLEYDKILFPSFSVQLLLNNLDSYLENTQSPTAKQLQTALLKLAESALETEKEHLLNSIQTFLEQTEDNLNSQTSEREDSIDTFFDNLDEREDKDTVRPQDLLLEASNIVHIPLRLESDQLRRLSDGDRDIKQALKDQVRSLLQKIALQRILGAIERRLEEKLDSRLLQEDFENWGEAANRILEMTETMFDQRKQRLLGEDGQIAHDLEVEIARYEPASLTDTRTLISLMRAMSQGTRVSFDRRTHRRGRSQFSRLKYVYLAARLMADAQPEKLTDEILDHLTGARDALQQAWGMMEWQRLSMNDVKLVLLEERVKKKIIDVFGEEHFTEVSTKVLSELDEEDKQEIQYILGDRLQNEIYRHLLLTTISDQWIEYLTKVEALRVSIGLEAYAQRDPLVAYKGKATEMFKELLASIRMEVIRKMYTYRPRQGNEAAVERKAASESQLSAPAEASAVEQPSPENQGTDEPAEEEQKRRRRHKRR